MNKKNVWYVGYFIAFSFLIIMFLFDLDKSIEIMCTCLFSSIFASTFVITNHNRKMIKDRNYRAVVNDERNLYIRGRVNNMMAPLYMLLFGIQSIYCIAYDLYFLAAFNGIIVFLSPLLMIVISNYYEKRM